MAKRKRERNPLVTEYRKASMPPASAAQTPAKQDSYKGNNQSGLEKANLVAQWCAPIALLIAVLSWYEVRLTRTEANENYQLALDQAKQALDEAKLARKEQADFFLAEKAPDIKVKRAWLSEGDEKGVFEIDFQNTGQSMARIVAVRIGMVVPKEKVLRPLASKKLNLSSFDVKNGQTLSIPLFTTQELKEVVGFVPREVISHDPQLMDSGNGSTWLRIFYEFLDVQNHTVESSALIELRK